MRSLIDPTILARTLEHGITGGFEDRERRRQEELAKERQRLANERGDQDLVFSQLGSIDPGTAVSSLAKLRSGQLDISKALANAGGAKASRDATARTQAREDEGHTAGLRLQTDKPELATAFQRGLVAPSGPTYDKPEVGPQVPEGSLAAFQRPAGLNNAFSQAGSLASQLAAEATTAKANEAEADRQADFRRTKLQADVEAGREERKYKVSRKEAIATRGIELLSEYPEEQRSSPEVLKVVKQRLDNEVANGLIKFDSGPKGSLSFGERDALKDKDILKELISAQNKMQSFDPAVADLLSRTIQRLSSGPATGGTVTPTVAPSQPQLPDDPAQLKAIIRANPGTPQAKAALAKLEAMQ